MKLSDYMREHDLDPEEMAAIIGGVSVSGVRKWANGERVPRVEQMRRIVDVTGGAVEPNDFILTSAEAAE